MRYSTRSLLATTLAAGLIAASLPTMALAFSAAEQTCRSSVAKSGGKFIKTALKAITGCHKSRDAGDTSSGTDCNDITQTDSAGKVTDAATKYGSTVADKCVGIAPGDVLYQQCPDPCNGAAPTMTTFGNVVDCLVCLARNGSESFSDAAIGTPPSPPLSDTTFSGGSTSPDLPPPTDDGCHTAVAKSGAKFYNSAVKAVTKCQANEEKKFLSESTALCTMLTYDSLVGDAYTGIFKKCLDGIYKACGGAGADAPTAIDPCGNSLTVFDMAGCVCDDGKTSAKVMARQLVDLTGPVATTTTSTSTTSTTLPPSQDPQCPDLGELTLFSKMSNQVCSNNTECTLPRTCDTATSRCTTVADLDTGWTGLGHNSDINDAVTTRASLFCPGGAPVCGECTVTGLDPSSNNCRCSNNARTICDQPFQVDGPQCPACVGGNNKAGLTCTANTDCLDASSCSVAVHVCSNSTTTICATNADCPGTGSCSKSKTACANSRSTICTNNSDCAFQGTCNGAATCDCYFGAPFPLNSAGTHVCVVNRFSEDITGTANVDAGSGSIDARLRAKVYLGIVARQPCPSCGGKCSSPPSSCSQNSDCTMGNPPDDVLKGVCNTVTHLCSNGCERSADCPGNADCVQDTPNDNVRDGICIQGANNGQSCDVTATNASFPALLNTPTPGGGGGGYSLDCQPDDGKGISGAGLKIVLSQSTGTTTLASGLDCDASGPGTAMCPCGECTLDQTDPCTSDAECASEGSFCTQCSEPSTCLCSTNAECIKNVGPCTTNTHVCTNASSITCTTNADCSAVSLGPCVVSTCTRVDRPGNVVKPKPNGCNGLCQPLFVGSEEGQCDSAGPNDKYCDSLVRADGSAMASCSSNTDCGGGLGTCSVVTRRVCFLDPIVATGAADPVNPVAGAVFCVPATSNGGVNNVAGLPGPGRVISQGGARTFCASDHGTQYSPNVGGCPP